jgi:hypothetical protein
VVSLGGSKCLGRAGIGVESEGVKVVVAPSSGFAHSSTTAANSVEIVGAGNRSEAASRALTVMRAR